MLLIDDFRSSSCSVSLDIIINNKYLLSYIYYNISININLLERHKETMNLSSNDLIALLEDLDSPFTAHESEGYFSGLVSCNLEKGLYSIELNKYFDYQKLKLDHYEFLEKYIIELSTKLNEKSFSPSFDTEVTDKKKLIALGQWSKGYSLAISIVLDKKYIKNNLELQEIIHDFEEIGKIEDEYNFNSSDEDKRHYDNIRDYVLTSVNYVFAKTK